MFKFDKTRLKGPRKDGKLLWGFIALCRLGLTGLIAFLLGLVICGYGIPIVSTGIAGMTGVGYESDFLSVLILLIFPSLAASAILVTGYIFLIRRINGALKSAMEKARARRREAQRGKG